MNYERLAVGLALVTGCAGGGSSVHIAPPTIAAGAETPLLVEMTVWGAGWGRLSRRYRDVACHYRTARDSATHVLTMTVVSEERDQLVTQCLLPPLAPEDSAVTYWFTFTLDGHANRRPPETVGIR